MKNHLYHLQSESGSLDHPQHQFGLDDTFSPVLQSPMIRKVRIDDQDRPQVSLDSEIQLPEKQSLDRKDFKKSVANQHHSHKVCFEQNQERLNTAVEDASPAMKQSKRRLATDEGFATTNKLELLTVQKCDRKFLSQIETNNLHDSSQTRPQEMNEHEVGRQQMNVILTNCRKFLLSISIVLAVTDFAMIYPRFHQKKLWPNQVAIIVEGMAQFPVYFLLAHSFLRKSLANVKAMMVLMVVRIQMGFLQLPGEEVGVNHDARAFNKVAVQTFSLLQLLQLSGQVFENKKCVFWAIVVNVLLMYVWIIALYHNEGGAFDDFMNYAAVVVVSTSTQVIFTFIERSNVLANVTRSIKQFELEQYKDMFNSLHEGILVVNLPNQAEGNRTPSIFFANEIMQLIVLKLLRVK